MNPLIALACWGGYPLVLVPAMLAWDKITRRAVPAPKVVYDPVNEWAARRELEIARLEAQLRLPDYVKEER